MLKQELRQIKISERKAISWWKRIIWNRQIYRFTRHFLAKEKPAIKNIAIYWSNPDEVNTHALVVFLLKNNYRVSLATIDQNYCMSFREIKQPDFAREDIHKCTQPSGIYPTTPSETIDLFLVPLVAFDKNKHRLGYGKGCFDRYLGSINHAKIVGLAYSIQWCDEIPCEPHDRQLDYVITNKGII